jgi:XTP/dITP diphosphohydrolase
VTGRPVLLLATRSQGKLSELAPLAAAHGWQVETLARAGVPERSEEDGLEVAETFAGNAFAKARYFAARTGRLVLAEDSGVEVVALGGAPGVRSKRWGADGGAMAASAVTGDGVDAGGSRRAGAAAGPVRVRGGGRAGGARVAG